MPPSSSTKNEKSSIRPMIMMKAQKSSIQSGASAKLMMPKRSAVEPALVRQPAATPIACMRLMPESEMTSVETMKMLKTGKERQDAPDDLHRHGQPVDLDADDHVRVQGVADFRHAHAHEHEQAHDLEATARAADAAADKDEHEEHEAREIRPVPARRGDKAARRQEGRRLEQAVAQALRRIVDTRAAEIPGDEHTAREKEPRVSLQFRIAQHEPEAQPVPDLPAEQRIEAREQHRDAGRELQRDAVIGDEVTRVSRAARRQRHHRLRQGREGVEPGQQVEHKRKPRQRSVNTEALTRRLSHLVPDRAEKCSGAPTASGRNSR